MKKSRRTFLSNLGQVTGALVLAPVVSRCVRSSEASTAAAAGVSGAAERHAALSVPPKTRPPQWDPISYNRERGNAGAIPGSYLDDINGPDGESKHLGKHLPYVPSEVAGPVPSGYLPLMWGDPDKGYAKHPNADVSEDNPEGHWYNWIRIRKAVDDAEEVESQYSAWPTTAAGDSGQLVAAAGSDPAADDGKNTVYLAVLPAGVGPGDWVRIYAHCKTHGEYVDFLEIPGA